MNRTVPLTGAGRLHVASLVIACAGFLIQLAAGVPEFQPFPPGVVVLLATAIAAWVWPAHRWPPLVGTALCVAIFVGAFFLYSGTMARLTDPADIVPFLGTVIQMGGIVAAIATGILAVARPAAPARITT